MENIINTITEQIVNLKPYDYNNEDETKLSFEYITKDHKIKYFSIHKENWNEDAYLLCQYTTQDNWSKSIRRTTTFRFTLEDMTEVIKKLKNINRKSKSIDRIFDVKLY